MTFSRASRRLNSLYLLSTEFLADTPAQTAVLQAIADLVGVPLSYIAAIFSATVEAANVKCDYTIAFPPTATVNPTAVKSILDTKTTTEIATAVQNKLGKSYTVSVDSKTSVTITTRALTGTTNAVAQCLLQPIVLFTIMASQHLS